MINNESRDVYKATKVILNKGKNKAYIGVPKWLIGRDIMVTVIDTGSQIIKKAVKNGSGAVINFSGLISGLRVEVKNIPR